MVPESEKLEKGKPGARKVVAASWEAGTWPCQSRLACLLRWLASYVHNRVAGWLAPSVHRTNRSRAKPGQNVCLCMYVCMYVRMYVCMYVCLYVSQSPYVSMYVCMYVCKAWLAGWLAGWLPDWRAGPTHVPVLCTPCPLCMYVCMHVWIVLLPRSLAGWLAGWLAGSICT